MLLTFRKIKKNQIKIKYKFLCFLHMMENKRKIQKFHFSIFITNLQKKEKNMMF